MISLKEYPKMAYPNGKTTEEQCGVISFSCREWRDAFVKELLEELAPKINPAYEEWNTLEATAKVQVYLRVLGMTKEEAWKKIKELKLS